MASKLLSIFVRLKGLYQDVIHDMGDSEECLIDGESLFLEAILDARCPAGFSGVPLQLVYYVECFLSKLDRHGGRFRIVFFKAYGLIWRSIPEVATLRDILVAHLRRTLPGHTVQVFRRWWNKSNQQAERKPSKLERLDGCKDSDGDDNLDFIRLLVSMRPAFILVSSLLSELHKLRLESCETPNDNTVPIRWHKGDMRTVRQRLLGSEELQRVAELSMGLLLRCLRNSAVVPLSSLDLDVATRPFGFLLDVDGCAVSLQLDRLTKAVHVITAPLALGNVHQLSGSVVARRGLRVPSRSVLEKGDVLAARAIQYILGEQSLPLDTPRTALAAAVISSLQDDGHFRHSTKRMDALVGLWLTEVYLLHAVLLDYSCLEDRALALPYGSLRRLYDAPSSSVAALGGSAAIAGIISGDQDAATTVRLSSDMMRFMKKLVLPLVSNAVRSRIWDEAINIGASGIISRGGSEVNMAEWSSGGDDDDDDDGSSCMSLPLPLQLPPCTIAALADPYQGPQLHALLIALVIMRSTMEEQALSKIEGQQFTKEQRHTLNAAPKAAVAAHLGLPLAASKTWHTARRLAGLPNPSPRTPECWEDVIGGPEVGFGTQPCGSTGNFDGTHAPVGTQQGNADDLGDLLLENLLESMPYKDGDGHFAGALRVLLLGSDAKDGYGGGEGLAAALDRRAQQVLVEAFQLPEPMRRNPVVQTVEQLWERVVPQPTSMATATTPVAVAARSGGSTGAAARKSSAAAAVPEAASMTTIGAWGPWAHLVAPALQERAGSGGCDGGTNSVLNAGHFEEIYHWHSRSPLMPAFLTQADSREAARQYMLRKVAMTPIGADFGHFIRCMAQPYRKQAIWLMNAKERKGARLKALVTEGVVAYFGLQDQKEERALRRLIDSMQGGVTFFRSGGAGGGGGGGSAAAATTVAISSTQQLVISSLDEIRNVAHLEAIRQDRQGKVALTALLRDSKMSPADLKRRLAKVEEVREVEQRRTAARQGSIFQGEVARWNEIVVPHLAKRSADDTMKALQRFCSHTATRPEFRSIVAVLQLQIHMKSLCGLIKATEGQDRRVDERTGGGDTGKTVRSRGSAGDQNEVPNVSVQPVFGSLLPAAGRGRKGDAEVVATGQRRIPADKSGSGDGDNVSGNGGSGAASVAMRYGGDLPRVMQRALAAVLESLAGVKELCRTGGQQALWVQPCPLLNEPRVAAPCLAIACAALEALGFGDAAERLRQEAGCHDASHLLHQAKAMDARLKALSKRSGADDAPGGGGSQASSSTKTKTGKTATAAAAMRKGSASKSIIGSSPEEHSELESAVDDAVLTMYSNIRASNLGFEPLPLGISLVRFQLRCMGDRLERLASGVPDPRVAFIPDDWQRRLLDIVDTGGSAVVSAPTSSGKTFISSYVIRKVLDAHQGRGRVVVVVPTKSLVLQVNAQIARDFHDVRNLPDGTVVQGTFTRDFRCNSMVWIGLAVALPSFPNCLICACT
ncbi:hypothetical protein Vretifemale_8630 [Volvox reticuliferus]|uniref:Helicase ATP-binding domain-containing protein n=1 Tax=Volvox reticuliferus TaxID=1737510 RepID=A0A8J4CCX3_9CHLO|nr:hypothetical protein Vretifemale_8630 [Volvox reticuliferus]